MRCFIALTLPLEAREGLAEIALACRRALTPDIDRLPRSLPRLSWTKSESYHLTLAFLGEIEGGAIEVAAAALDAALDFGDIAFSIAGTGTFPPRAEAWRVLYARLEDGGRTELIYRLVNEALARGATRAALPPLNREWPGGRPFSAHVTLARAAGGAHKLGRIDLPAPADPRPELWTISRCCLFKSELGSSGPVYTELRAVELSKRIAQG